MGLVYQRISGVSCSERDLARTVEGTSELPEIWAQRQRAYHPLLRVTPN